MKSKSLKNDIYANLHLPCQYHIVVCDYLINVLPAKVTNQFLYVNCSIQKIWLHENKGNNKITELRTILQRESQNS